MILYKRIFNKNLIINLITLWILIITFVFEASAVSWKGIGPGGGGTAEAVIIDHSNESIIYTGINCGGNRKSVDGGESWQQINKGLKYFEFGNEADDVAGLVIHPLNDSILFLGGKDKIYKSVDKGANWIEKFSNVNRTFTEHFDAVTFSISNLSVIYSGTGNIEFEKGNISASGIGAGNIYKSFDGGEAWSRIEQNESQRIDNTANIFSLAVHPLDSEIIYASTDRGIYKSIDGGFNWELKNNGLPYNETWKIVINPFNSSILYSTIPTKFEFNIWNGGVYKSVDGGENWLAFNNGLNQSNRDSEYVEIMLDPNNQDIIYIANPISQKSDLGGIYKFENDTWIRLSREDNIIKGWVDRPLGARAFAISKSSEEIIFSSKGGALYKSVDKGESWDQIYTKEISPDNFQTTGLDFIGGTGFAVDPGNNSRQYATFGDHGIWKSEDNGISFRNVIFEADDERSFQNLNGIFIDNRNNSVLYSTTGFLEKKEDDEGRANILRSTDFGETWELIGGGKNFSNKNGLPTGLMLDFTLDFSNNSRLLIVVHERGVFKSEDRGESWISINNGILNNKVISIAQDPSNASILYVGAREPGEIYKSTDYGESWSVINADDIGNQVNSLNIDGRNNAVYAATNKGIFKSENLGINWIELLEMAESIEILVNPRNSSILYVGSRRNGVMKSIDSGLNWVEINEENNSKDVFEFLSFHPTNPNILYTGFKCGGLFKIEEDTQEEDEDDDQDDERDFRKRRGGSGGSSERRFEVIPSFDYFKTKEEGAKKKSIVVESSYANTYPLTKDKKDIKDDSWIWPVATFFISFITILVLCFYYVLEKFKLI